MYINNGAGQLDVRQGGSLSWRDNNPGNIIAAGGFAFAHGAIEVNGRFAIFPDYSTGWDAMITNLNTAMYQAMTVSGAIAAYAPAMENNPAAYADFVTNALGVSLDTQMSTLTRLQLNEMGQAIQTYEGWRGGTSTDWFINF